MTYPTKQPGDKSLEARTWNALVKHLETENTNPPTPPYTPTAQTPLPYLWLRNATGYDLSSGAILELGAPRRDAAAERYRRQIYLDGTTPTDPTPETPFAILLGPVTAAAITGHLATHGIAATQLEITDPAHTHAELISGDHSRLRSAPAGPCRIHHAAHTTGTAWALVEILRSGAADTLVYATPAEDLPPATHGCPGIGIAHLTPSDAQHCHAADSTEIRLANFKCSPLYLDTTVQAFRLGTHDGYPLYHVLDAPCPHYVGRATELATWGSPTALFAIATPGGTRTVRAAKDANIMIDAGEIWLLHLTCHCLCAPCPPCAYYACCRYSDCDHCADDPGTPIDATVQMEIVDACWTNYPETTPLDCCEDNRCSIPIFEDGSTYLGAYCSCDWLLQHTFTLQWTVGAGAGASACCWTGPALNFCTDDSWHDDYLAYAATLQTDPQPPYDAASALTAWLATSCRGINTNDVCVGAGCWEIRPQLCIGIIDVVWDNDQWQNVYGLELTLQYAPSSPACLAAGNQLTVTLTYRLVAGQAPTGSLPAGWPLTCQGEYTLAYHTWHATAGTDWGGCLPLTLPASAITVTLNPDNPCD